MKVANIFEAIPEDLQREMFEPIITGAGVRIERIVSRGQRSPASGWYDQDDGEWVMVVRGAARLDVEGQGVVELGAGDYLNIAPHVKHRVEWTDPEAETIWLAVHYS